MDNKALFNLTYGVFVLSAKAGDKVNGCITNTCIQVANSPTRVAISVLNTNYTCDLIKEGGVFCLSLLDKTCTMDTIRYFGFQSGRNVDKFGQMRPKFDANGVPYLGWQSCAYLSCRVVSSQDLGSHTLFIAEVEDAQVLSQQEPLTYAYYQNVLKPKPQPKTEDKKITGWRCKICGYVYEGSPAARRLHLPPLRPPRRGF